MPRWKPRDPGVFPAHFTETVLTAERSRTPIVLSLSGSAYEVKRALDRFREFRMCLRSWPNAHRAVTIERNFRIKTFTVEDLPGQFVNYVQVLEKPLNSLSTLNPHLADILARA